MELYQLRSFVAVAELGHLTRAAEQLHLSQPALSAQIKALEEEFELDLFERKPSGMVPTAAGRRLLGQAQELLARAQALRNDALALRGSVSGVVRVGTLSDAQFIRLGEVTSAAVACYPQLEIQLSHEVTGAAFEKVRDGALDAAFYYGELTDPAVSGIALRKVTYRIAAPAAWRERIEGMSWAQIATEPWIMTPPISTHHQLANELFHAHAITPTRVVQADDEFVVASLIEAGVGMALMREDIALDKARSGAVCLWGEARLVTPLRFVFLRSRESDPVLRALVDLVAEVWLPHSAARRTRCAPKRPRPAAPAPAPRRPRRAPASIARG